jgi:hypothetical protein
MAFQNRADWVAALEKSVETLLAQRTDLSNTEDYRLTVTRCNKHDSSCVCVVFGEVMEHVRWAATDPDELAATRMAAVLPPLPKGKP